MVDEALVLNGNTGVDEVLGHVLILHPSTVGAAVKLLQHHVLTRFGVFIVDDGRLVKREALDGKIDLLRQIVFDIQRKQACEDQCRQEEYQQHRAEYLSDRAEDAPGAAGAALGCCAISMGHNVPPCMTVKTGAVRPVRAQCVSVFFY